MRYDLQLEWLENCKVVGMDAMELTLAMCRDCVPDNLDGNPHFYTEDQLLAVHSRAAGYCYGEYLANHYEMPLADRPSLDLEWLQAQFGLTLIRE